ncbi:hypothetical protein EJB05_55226, partial [Eragrostis curvula]
MVALPSTGKATSPAVPPWSALPPKLADLVLRHLPSDADRIRFAAVCRHWNHHIARQATSSSRWSALQPELVDLVLRRLYSHADRVRFVTVCRHWRHVARNYSAPLPPALPWLCSTDGACESLPDSKLYNLRFWDGEYSCQGSFGNFLLLNKEIGSSHRFLEDPLSGDTVQLPIQLYDSRRCSITESFDILKVIVCSSDHIAAMVRFDGDYFNHMVVCCRPGMPEWSTRRPRNIRNYQDMAFHEGSLYAVASGGDLFLHEVTKNSESGEPMVRGDKQVIQSPPWDGLDEVPGNRATGRLVISRTGKLLLVRWIVDISTKLTLHVFEADFEMGLWLQVESFDDQVLFVSSNCSRAMSASVHDDCLQANTIYLIDDVTMFWKFWPDPNAIACMYDMRSKTIHHISLGDRFSETLDAAWFFPTSISS